MVEKNVFRDIIYLKSQIGMVLNKKMNLFERIFNHPGRKLNCNTLIIFVLRPPLLQKEGKLIPLDPAKNYT